ncbi:hypothetical protein [Streptomyces sp. NEAU-H3]|uniref:hypothetical protein n=1 Tax=Streptomyces sp. NEAU-H3 TaxID=2720636 RepID=UPI001FD7400A|nr:hypothetical protein [Streptomyces sp. NEAU-H3]
MDWFSAENVVAIGTAVLGVAASIVLLWYERRVPRRRHLGYRVQVDMPIRARAGARTTGRVTPGSLGLLDGFGEDGLGDDGPDGPDGEGRVPHGRALSLVLLRVENDGAETSRSAPAPTTSPRTSRRAPGSPGARAPSRSRASRSAGASTTSFSSSSTAARPATPSRSAAVSSKAASRRTAR